MLPSLQTTAKFYQTFLHLSQISHDENHVLNQPAETAPDQRSPVPTQTASPNAVSTSVLCSAGRTFSNTLAMVPFSSIRNVVRNTPS